MAYNYDLEAALQKLPNAVEVVDTFATQRVRQVTDIVMDTAKEVGADKLTKVCQTLVDALEASGKMYGEVVGTDGDTMHDGTLRGALKGTQEMNAALNG